MTKLLRYRDLIERQIVSNRMTLRRWIAQQDFPAPMRLGPNSVAWREDEIERWLDTRLRPPQTHIAT